MAGATSMQCTVAGTDLDNGTTRQIVGEIRDSTSLEGERLIEVDFLIESDSEANFNTLYDATYSAFVTDQVTVVIAPYIGTLDPDAGTYNQIRTTVIDNPQHAKSTTSIICTLLIYAHKTDKAVETATSLPGLVEFTVTDFHGPNQALRRTCMGAFVSTSTLTAALAYDGSVEDIRTTYLLTETDGAWSSTSGMVQTSEHEQIFYEKNRVEFVIEAEKRYSPLTEMGSLARRAEISIVAQHPDSWPESQGDPPTLITATGKIIVDLSEQSTLLHELWETKIKTDVEAAITADGLTPTTLLRHSMGVIRDQGVVQFTAVYRDDDATLFAYGRQDRISDTPDQTINPLSDGKHHVQAAPTSPNRVRAVKIRRVGVGRVDLTPPTPAPTISGRKCWYVGGEYVVDEPVTQNGQVTGVYAQEWQGSWVELAIDTSDLPQPPVFTDVGF